MVKKKIIRVYAPLDQPNVMIVNGEKYIISKETTKIIDHHLHGDKIIFEPFNEDEHKKDVEFVVNNIIEMVDKKRLLTEIIKKTDYAYLKKIKELMKKKKSVKVTNGCYGLTIGDDSKGAMIELA